MTTHYAAIDATEPVTGGVYGIGTTPEAAEADALRQTRGADGAYAIVSCTPAAARYVDEYGGAPDHDLSVSLRGGVCLRSEEE